MTAPHPRNEAARQAAGKALSLCYNGRAAKREMPVDEMNTIVLGLGNPLLRDDGIGLLVTAALKARLDGRAVTVAEPGAAGLNLLDLLEGYKKAIIIDAIQTEGGRAGQVHRLQPDDLRSTLHASSTHDVNFATALELGRRLGLDLPREIVIFGIEVADVTTFGEECTPDVKAAVPICVETVLREVNGGNDAHPGRGK